MPRVIKHGSGWAIISELNGQPLVGIIFKNKNKANQYAVDLRQRGVV